MSVRPDSRLLACVVFAAFAAGCSGGQSSMGNLPPASSTQNSSNLVPAKAHGILGQLKKQVVIGSTIDPVFGQLNPYGLDVAKRSEERRVGKEC